MENPFVGIQASRSELPSFGLKQSELKSMEFQQLTVRIDPEKISFSLRYNVVYFLIS